MSGILKAIDRISGKLLWSYATENQIAGSANVWTAGNKSGIVVGSYDYFLHCVDPETGKLLWKVETENYINGTPSISNGKIVFGGCDGIIRIVDPLTGQRNRYNRYRSLYCRLSCPFSWSVHILEIITAQNIV